MDDTKIEIIFDLMKRPDELESLADALKSVGTCQPWEDDVIFKAADILIGLSQIFKGIPVETSLPKNAEDVLVTDGSDVFIAWHTDDGWNSHSELFYPDSYPIVKWLPIPDFTKEKC
jgi:hypothetical protein